MNLEQLKYLSIIEKHNSITAAAESLFISQQALSRAVKKLEDEIGIVLLTRSTSGSVLTREGKIFVEKARQVLDIIDSFYSPETFIQSTNKVQKTIKIYCANNPSRYSFNKVILYFAKIFPHVRFSLLETSFEDTLKIITEDPTAIGFMSPLDADFDQYFPKQIRSNYTFQKIAVDSIVALVSSTSELVSKQQIKIDDILSYPIIVEYPAFISLLMKNYYYSDLNNVLCSKSLHYELESIRKNQAIGLAVNSVLKPFQNDPSLTTLHFEKEITFTHYFFFHKDYKITEIEETLFYRTKKLFE